LRGWLHAAEINHDRNLRLQYLAGLQLDSNKGADAYLEIIGRRVFPTDIFRASPEKLKALNDVMAVPIPNP
jgi:spermidine synthase